MIYNYGTPGQFNQNPLHNNENRDVEDMHVDSEDLSHTLYPLSRDGWINNIFSRLDPSDLNSLMQVSQQTNDFASSNLIWHWLAEKNEIPIENNNLDCFQLFRNYTIQKANAKDACVTWEKIAEAINQPIDLQETQTTKNWIETAAGFSKWCEDNQANLQNIDELNLSNCNLQSLPKEIVYLTQLAELNLSNNQISSLPQEMETLKNLWSLNLSNNQLSSLPPEISNLVFLRDLNLDKNKLQSLDPGISNLIGLVRLNLNNNKFEVFPPEILGLTKLKFLEIHHNRLQSLSDLINLTDLQMLDVSHNAINSLPDLTKLENLSMLDITYNPLQVHPTQLNQLKNKIFIFNVDHGNPYA